VHLLTFPWPSHFVSFVMILATFLFLFRDPLKSKQTNLKSILVLFGSLILLITFDFGFLQEFKQVCFIKEPPKS
jgi:hypothetical protein